MSQSKWCKIYHKFSSSCYFLASCGPSQVQSVPGWQRSTQTAWTGQRSFPSSFFSFRAYKSYKAAVEAGDDGEPHFHARKACDYLKSAVEVICSVEDGQAPQNTLLKESDHGYVLKFGSGLRQHASWRLLHWGRGSQTEGRAGEEEGEIVSTIYKEL